MSERKYTDEEIIKALGMHSDEEIPCVGLCPYSETPYCGSDMARDALNLINRKKAEIAVLTTAVDNSTKEFLKLHDEYQDQKKEIEKFQEVNADLNESLRLAAEANKDLQTEVERLQKYNTDVAFKHCNDGIKEFTDYFERKIDNLVAEMTEGK